MPTCPEDTRKLCLVLGPWCLQTPFQQEGRTYYVTCDYQGMEQSCGDEREVNDSIGVTLPYLA